MPRGIPVGTLAIGKAGAANAALLAAQILATHDKELHQRLNDWRKARPTKCWKTRPARCGMKQVCVLGNGQLGRMLRQAGEPFRHCCLAGRAGR